LPDGETTDGVDGTSPDEIHFVDARPSLQTNSSIHAKQDVVRDSDFSARQLENNSQHNTMVC